MFRKCYDAHNNVASINDKIITFLHQKWDFKVILMSNDNNLILMQ